MTTHDDIRRMIQKLPGAVEGEGEQFGVCVMVKGKPKGFAWCWREKFHPKKPKIVNNEVLAVPVRSLLEKEILLGSNSKKFFTEPHYDGFPAVLVRLPEIEPDELEELLIEAWRCKAPAQLVKQYEESQPVH